MTRKEMNFIRATARGIRKATLELSADENANLIAALTSMTNKTEHPLTASEVGYFAVMYLAAHDWEVPD